MSGFINIEDCNFDDIFVKEIYHEPSDCTENSLLFYYLSCKGNREYNAEIECAISIRMLKQLYWIAAIFGMMMI